MFKFGQYLESVIPLTNYCMELEQNAMEEVGKLVEERTVYRIEDQVDLETEVLNRRTKREEAEDEEKLQEVTTLPTATH